MVDDDDKPASTPAPARGKPTRAGSSLVIGDRVLARAHLRLNGRGDGRARPQLSRKSRRALMKALSKRNPKPLSLRLRVR